MVVARYDPHADWYEGYVSDPGSEHYRRVRGMAGELLGRGSGRCLDVCCGTGIHAEQLRELGYSPTGVDVSAGQLGYARSRLPVAQGDAARLPFASGSMAAVSLIHAHTDLDDYPATVAEAARVLVPGGRLVLVGCHPCFIGAFADRGDPEKVVLTSGYDSPDWRYDGWNTTGVRARTGARQVPLAALVNAVLDAGLVLGAVREAGPPGGYPDLLGFRASKPHGEVR
ncbi:MAG: Methyltransferase type 11 [Actinomycetia bacterium]|nr:Methyltransferase type 11 [Actinomycetes bacterium]